MSKVRPSIVRSRQCMFVLYPESQQVAIDYAMQNFPCAWALHDKDVYTESDFKRWVGNHDGLYPDWMPGGLKKPHYHFVCRFPNARYFSGIAKELDVPVNTINRCNNLYKAFVYLWHMDDPDKFQYDSSIVGIHDFDVPSEVQGISADEDEQLKIMLQMPAFSTISELTVWAYENGCWKVFRDNYHLWKDIMHERRTLWANGRNRVEGIFVDSFELMRDIDVNTDDIFNIHEQ